MIRAFGNLFIFLSNNLGGMAIALILIGLIDAFTDLFISSLKSKNNKIAAKIKPEVERIQEEYKDDEDKRDEVLAELYDKEGYNSIYVNILFVFKVLISILIFSIIGRNQDIYRLEINNIGFFSINDLTRSGFTYLTVIYIAYSLLRQWFSLRIQRNYQYTDTPQEAERKRAAMEKRLEGLTQEQIDEMQKIVNKREIAKIMTGSMPKYGLILIIAFALSRSILIYSITSNTIYMIMIIKALIESEKYRKKSDLDYKKRLKEEETKADKESIILAKG